MIHPALMRLLVDPTGTHIYVVPTCLRQRQMFEELADQMCKAPNSPDVRFYANGNRIKHKAGGQLMILPGGDPDKLRGLRPSSIDRDGDVEMHNDFGRLFAAIRSRIVYDKP